MRKIIAFNNLSADGYIADVNGSLDWVVPDDEMTRAGLAGMPESDAILFGRRTYEMFEAFWPHALDESETSEDPHAPGRRSTTVRKMAEWINEAEKIVFSRTRTEAPWRNSRIEREIDRQAIEELKAQRGGNLMLFGSASVTRVLAAHGLIDEYQYAVSPVLLGDGLSLLRDVPHRTRVELREATPFGSGVVLMRYATLHGDGNQGDHV